MLQRLFALLLCLSPACIASAQDTLNFPVLGEVVQHSDQLNQYLEKDAKIEVLGSGFVWTEGPVWVPEGDGYLLFSDIPRNSVMKWVRGEGVSLFMKPSGFTGPDSYGGEAGCNGLALDHEGRLLSCEHGDRRISVLTKNGGKRTLADNYQGKRFNSPNDLVVHSSGAIYFTDPPYGLPGNFNDPRRELDYCGVFRLDPNGTVSLVSKDFDRPNGIALSPDEKTLYVAQSDSKAAIWKSFPVKADGSLGKGKILFDATDQMGKLPGAPDGMCVAKDGTIFATGPGGVYVLTPEGKLLGRISTGERTANCTFGGKDGSILFMTADMYLCQIQTKTQGLGFK